MATIRASTADSAIREPAGEDFMQTAVLQEPGHFRLRALPKPDPGPREVRVRLQGCGLCASNLAPFQGREWFDYPFEPGNPGHEGWGVVEKVGAQVDELKPGDRVAALSFNAFSTHDIAGADACVRLPPELDEVPFPGEALGCAMNIFERADIQPGQTVAIVGAGFLGTLLCELISRAGARVIAISRRETSLKFARQFGAEHALPLAEHPEVIARVEELTNGKLCERVIECVGLQAPLDLAAELTAVRAKLVIAGYHQDSPRTVNMQQWNWRGIDVINAHERDPKRYLYGMQRAVDAIKKGCLEPSTLFTHQFPLSQINQAFKVAIERPNSFMKALIIPKSSSNVEKDSAPSIQQGRGEE